MEHTNYVKTWKNDMITNYNVIILGIMYLLFGLTFSYFINIVSPPVNKRASKLVLLIEIIAEVGITTLFAYYLHKLIEILPLPMLGSREEQTNLIGNIRGGIIIAFSMFALQVKLKSKVQLLFGVDTDLSSFQNLQLHESRKAGLSMAILILFIIIMPVIFYMFGQKSY